MGTDPLQPVTSEEAVLKAIEVFEHPYCEPAAPCIAVDFTDVFQMGVQKPLDAEKTRHLSLGLFWLLESLGFVRETIRKKTGETELSYKDKQNLTDYYFPLATRELRLGGVHGAVYGALKFLEGGMHTGAISEKEVVAFTIEGTVLGYTVYLQDALGINLDWDTVREKMGVSKRETPLVVLTQPIPTPTVEPEPKKEEPPKNEEPSQKIEKKKKIRQKPKQPTQPQTQREKDFEEVAKKTGGKVTLAKLTDDIGEIIKKRIAATKPEKTKHLQIEILMDTSGSMLPNLEKLRSKVAGILDYAQRQVKKGGQVAIGIRIYGNGIEDHKERVIPLDSFEDLQSRALVEPHLPNKEFYKGQEIEEAKLGLNEAIHTTETTSSYVEYTWDESVEALKEEPWAPRKEDVERVLFVITDEDGTTDKIRYNKEAVIQEARAKKVRYEVILLGEKRPVWQANPSFNELYKFPQNHEFSLEMRKEFINFLEEDMIKKDMYGGFNKTLKQEYLNTLQDFKNLMRRKKDLFDEKY